MDSRIRRAAAVVLTVVGLGTIVVAAGGCAATGPQSTVMPSVSRAMPSASASASQTVMSASASGSVSTASSVQTCAQCGGKGAPPTVVGEAVTRNGVQVVGVGLVNGYYSPNTFTVKTGMPVRVVFTGKASGCLANPTFASLGKKADFADTGSATIDLGTLKPGVYEFTCAMRMNAGTITVK
jgi:plastocyanin